LGQLAEQLDPQMVAELVADQRTDDAGIEIQRARVEWLRTALKEIDDPRARRLEDIAEVLVPRSLWIVGGDGWAYDIGSAGLDHVLASGRNVNLIVLDTEVYSNTGGQASKATPRGAVAKFAARGKPTGKKDLGLLAASYGNVYVAQIALGANYNQTIKAILEAEAWPGPSLIIAYSTCIAHGIEMSTSMTHQKDAVRSGYWPLFRYTPGSSEHEHPFHLDSAAPSVELDSFLLAEGRFAMLARSAPAEAEHLRAMAQKDITERWRFYSQMAGVERSVPVELPADGETDG
jgi:pyruvate-ferredoxin/flavodoxin oxidoreductase